MSNPKEEFCKIYVKLRCDTIFHRVHVGADKLSAPVFRSHVLLRARELQGVHHAPGLHQGPGIFLPQRFRAAARSVEQAAARIRHDADPPVGEQADPALADTRRAAARTSMRSARAASPRRCRLRSQTFGQIPHCRSSARRGGRPCPAPCASAAEQFRPAVPSAAGATARERPLSPVHAPCRSLRRGTSPAGRARPSTAGTGGRCMSRRCHPGSSQGHIRPRSR